LRRKGADVNEGDGTMTPLHAAALFNKPDMAEWLLKYGARRDVKNFDGKTPLQIAEEKGHEAVAELLRKP
jgi:ankyrin repeat protein